MGVVDFSSVDEFRLSVNMIIQMAQREPCMPDGTTCPRVIVAPNAHVFDLARMFQILVENTRPLLTVVPTLHEAFEELGVESPHFEPLQ